MTSANVTTPSMTPKQGAILASLHQIGLGELRRRVLRGDENARLAEMADALDAYFAVCRAQLGHDRVPIAILETYEIIRQRDTLIGS